MLPSTRAEEEPFAPVRAVPMVPELPSMTSTLLRNAVQLEGYSKEMLTTDLLPRAPSTVSS